MTEKPQISAEAIDALSARVEKAMAQLTAATTEYDATVNEILGEALELGVPVNIVEAAPAPAAVAPGSIGDVGARDLLLRLNHDHYHMGEIMRILASWTTPGTNDSVVVMELTGDLPPDEAVQLAAHATALGWLL